MDHTARQRSRDYVINTTYFYRFFVPLIVSMLIFMAIAVIISYVPGTPVPWVPTFEGAFQTARAVGGRSRRL